MVLVPCACWRQVPDKLALCLKNPSDVRVCPMDPSEKTLLQVCVSNLWKYDDLLWKYDNNLAWPKPVWLCNSCPGLCHSDCAERLVNIDPCFPHPSQGKQHCPDYTVTKRSKPGESQQKTIWWHLRAVGYSGDDRHGCYLQTVNGLAGLGPSACSTGWGAQGCCGWCNEDVPHGSSETKGTLKIRALPSCLQRTE